MGAAWLRRGSAPGPGRGCRQLRDLKLVAHCRGGGSGPWWPRIPAPDYPGSDGRYRALSQGFRPQLSLGTRLAGPQDRGSRGPAPCPDLTGDSFVQCRAQRSARLASCGFGAPQSTNGLTMLKENSRNKQLGSFKPRPSEISNCPLAGRGREPPRCPARFLHAHRLLVPEPPLGRQVDRRGATELVVTSPLFSWPQMQV